MNLEWLQLFAFNIGLSVVMSLGLALLGAQNVSSRKSANILVVIQGAALGGLLQMAFFSESANWSFVAALVGAVFAALIASTLSRRHSDSTGLNLSLYALGMALMSSLVAVSPRLESHFSSRIFGDIAWLTSEQCIALLVIYVFIVILIFLNWRRWTLFNFNTSVLDFAAAEKQPLFIATTILALALSAQAVGILFSLGSFFIPTVFCRNQKDGLTKHTVKITLASSLGSFAGFLFSLSYPQLPTTAGLVLGISIASMILRFF